MAIKFDAITNGGIGSMTHTMSGSNRILFVALLCSGNGTNPSVTCNGAAMTQIVNQKDGAGNTTVYLYWTVGTVSGSNTIVTADTGSTIYFVSCVSYTGVRKTSPVTTQTSGTQTTTFSLSLTGSVLGSVGIFFARNNQGNDNNSTTGDNERTGGYPWAIYDSIGRTIPLGSFNMAMVRAGGGAVSYAGGMALFAPAPAVSEGSPMFFGGGVTIA